MGNEDNKLKAFGRFKLGETPREVSDALEGVSYAIALKWKKELKLAEDNQDVASLLKIDEKLLHDVVVETKKELEAAGVEPEAIEGEILELTDSVDGYKKLSTKMTKTAMKLTDKIDALATSVSEANDVIVLVEALAKLQIAFFNKSTTNVAVFPQQGEVSNSRVAAFNNLKRT